MWQLLYQLLHHVGGCVTLSESTHSQVDTQHAVVYGGSCVQAFLNALFHPGWAWEWVT